MKILHEVGHNVAEKYPSYFKKFVNELKGTDQYNKLAASAGPFYSSGKIDGEVFAMSYAFGRWSVTDTGKYDALADFFRKNKVE